MPAPSSGCQTCRSRHIKCDGARPTCFNCHKSSRHCTGWRAGHGSLLFLSENLYASTQIRRPKGGARWVPEFSDKNLSATGASRDERATNKITTSDTIPHPPSETACRTLLSRGGVDTRLYPSLQQPISDIAVNFFTHSYFRNATLSPENIYSLIKHHYGLNLHSSSDNTLNLAFSALSLVYYGSRKGLSAATSEGRKKYSRALGQMRNAIENSGTALSDEVLLATMIMATYENNVANSDQPKLLSYGFHHHQGALALLKLRQACRTAKCPSMSIDQCVRRQVIKTSIYQQIPVPEWLQDGSEFGEEDYQLELDRCFIRLASLRHKFASILGDCNDLSRLQKAGLEPWIETLIEDSVDILHSLSVWRSTLDPQYHFDILHGDLADLLRNAAALFYSTEMHSFHDSENASLWARYHGTRLFVAGVLLKLILVWRSVVSADPDRYNATARMAQADACVAANDICAGIPFTFGASFNTHKDIETVVKEAAPAAVCSLVWPLVILTGSPTSNESQRQWAKEKLVLVGRVMGNSTIKTVANMKLQARSQLGSEGLPKVTTPSAPKMY